MQFIRVRAAEEADPNAVIVVLFRCERGVVRGWYLGPMSSIQHGGDIPYVPSSKKMFAMVALVHARRVAVKMSLPVYVVDPDDLWEKMLNGS